MSTSSIYTALNGREIREMVKNRIIREIDALPHLREGNSFHRANVQFGFVMTAYPADVPVPNKELEFTIDAKSIQDFEDALNQIEKADELVEKLNEMKLMQEELTNLIKQTEEIQASSIFELDVQGQIDGAKPDAARIEHDLPVPVVAMKDGKKVETTISALEFKKIMK